MMHVLTFGAIRDIDNLAVWLPAIEGSALPVAGIMEGGGGNYDGRPDFVDEHSVEMRRAVETIRRLEVLGAQPSGRSHVLVLAFAYYWHGEQSRTLYQGGFSRHVGLAFTARELRFKWLDGGMHGNIKAGEHGAKLLEAARGAYEDLSEDLTASPRNPINWNRLREVCDEIDSQTRRDILAVRKVKHTPKAA